MKPKQQFCKHSEGSKETLGITQLIAVFGGLQKLLKNIICMLTQVQCVVCLNSSMFFKGLCLLILVKKKKTGLNLQAVVAESDGGNSRVLIPCIQDRKYVLEPYVQLLLS